MAEASVISVVLLPSAEDAAEMTRCSAAIGEAMPSAIRLGEEALPHITIAQFFAEPEEAPVLWKEVSQYQAAVSELTSIGLAFVPGRSRDETWVALDFMKSHAVATLQEAVLATKFARDHPMNNGSGDHYWLEVRGSKGVIQRASTPNQLR